MVSGAEQHRLGPAAHVQEAVGEDVAAVAVGGELDLVDGDEGHVEVARHGFHGATQKRASGGLIFSSPVTSATASAPDPSTTRS